MMTEMIVQKVQLRVCVRHRPQIRRFGEIVLVAVQQQDVPLSRVDRYVRRRTPDRSVLDTHLRRGEGRNAIGDQQRVQCHRP